MLNMKRTMIILAVMAATALAFTSCRKCMTCTAYEKTTNIMVDIDHWCGNSIEVNSDVDNFKTEWDYGLTYVECEKD